MAEDYYHHQHHLHYYHQFQHQDESPLPIKRRHRMKVADGEIVEVQGGHIVRSTGRKDRHSKVCTSKGPRDRRVRLSAHTAIQFYDVQDRLGYDRPSKAIDWLIMNAKGAIDELAELPPWNPIGFSGNPTQSPPDHETHVEEMENSSKNNTLVLDGIPHYSAYMFGDGSDTMKSSFYASHEEELRLSLQSIQDQLPIPVPEGVRVFDHMSQANWLEQNMAMAPWTIPAHGHSHVFTQREPLQSSSNIIPTMSLHHRQRSALPELASGEFFPSGFCIPARIQGEEEHVGFAQQLPSSSSQFRTSNAKQQTEP